MHTTLLLDTSVFSAVLKREPAAEETLLHHVRYGATILISPVVYYEILRGLLKRNARSLLRRLEHLLPDLGWIDMTRDDWDAAAELWAKTQRAGRPREEGDILIAAQANRRHAVVITRNLRHFDDIAEAEAW